MRLHINSKALQKELSVHKYQIMTGLVEIVAIQQAKYLRRILNDFGLKIGAKESKGTYKLDEI